MQDNTKNGLLMLMIGTLIALASNGIRAAGAMEPCLGAVGGLLSLLGLLFVFLGRKEFGEAHARNVFIALVLMVIGILIVIAGGFMIALAFLAGNPSSVSTGFYIIIVGGIVLGISNYFLLVELENDLGKKILMAAVLVTIMTQFLVAAIAGPAIEDMMDTLDQAEEEDWESDELEEELEDFQRDISVATAPTMAGQALMLLAFYIAYDRINKGELRPREEVRRRGPRGPMPPRGEHPCRRCGYPLVWVGKYSRWFCERCDDYD